MEDANLKHHTGGLSRRNVAALALGALALPIARPALGRGVEGPATAEDEKLCGSRSRKPRSGTTHSAPSS